MPTTIMTVTPNNTDGGDAGSSYRNLVNITGASLGQIRVTFASAPGGLQADHCAIAISAGTPNFWNSTVVPVELLFTGAHGFSIGDNVNIVSDWVNFSCQATDQLLVIMDWTAAGNENTQLTTGGAATGFQNYLFAGSATYNVQNPGSPTSTGANHCDGFILIETQASGGAPVLVFGTSAIHITKTVSAIAY